MQRILVFHPIIAPYRIDFFNDLNKLFDLDVSLFWDNLKDQKFHYDEILKELDFYPDFFSKRIIIKGREIPIGFIKRIKKYDPDLIIVNEYNESFWVSLAYRLFSKKKYKIISICDDSADIASSLGSLHSMARKLASKYIDGIILCNEPAQEVYRKKYPNMKTVVMPIVHDENKFLKNKKEIVNMAKENLIREKLTGKRVFLFVGRISPEKNIVYLINSFIEAHEDHPENILFIIGDHVPDNQFYYDEITYLIHKQNAYDYIRMIGRRDGEILKSWFYVGQVLVLPSVYEHFGAVTNEALMCGDYVMISQIAGSANLVDESNGEIIDIKKDSIDFEHINKRIPLIDNEYIDNKKNLMRFSYNSRINMLEEWLKEL